MIDAVHLPGFYASNPRGQLIVSLSSALLDLSFALVQEQHLMKPTAFDEKH